MSSSSTEAIEKLRQNGVLELANVFSQQRAALRKMVDYRLNDRLRGRIDASDVIQETFLKARNELQDYIKAPRYSPSVWLRVLNKRALAETHRKELAKRRMPDAVDHSQAAIEALSESVRSPSEVAVQSDLYARLTELFGSLSEIDQEILVIHHIEQVAIEDAAAELDIPVENAIKRYMRAIRRLRSLAKHQIGTLTH